jgi:hypothetical protein
MQGLLLEYGYCQSHGQDYMDMVNLHNKVDTQFEYLGNKLNAFNFRDCVN